jgi:hypothetical protein
MQYLYSSSLLCRSWASCMVNVETEIAGQNVHIGYREMC